MFSMIFSKILIKELWRIKVCLFLQLINKLNQQRMITPINWKFLILVSIKIFPKNSSMLVRMICSVIGIREMKKHY